MKKGQVLEGTIEKVEFPNKGVVTVAEEGKSVIVKNGIPNIQIGRASCRERVSSPV